MYVGVGDQPQANTHTNTHTQHYNDILAQDTQHGVSMVASFSGQHSQPGTLPRVEPNPVLNNGVQMPPTTPNQHYGTTLQPAHYGLSPTQPGWYSPVHFGQHQSTCQHQAISTQQSIHPLHHATISQHHNHFQPQFGTPTHAHAIPPRQTCPPFNWPHLPHLYRSARTTRPRRSGVELALPPDALTCTATGADEGLPAW